MNKTYSQETVRLGADTPFVLSDKDLRFQGHAFNAGGMLATNQGQVDEALAGKLRCPAGKCDGGSGISKPRIERHHSDGGVRSSTKSGRTPGKASARGK